MKAPLYNDILEICQKIANASTTEKHDERVLACQELQKLCATNQNTPKDHPLQWEALADFTDDGELAIDIYEVALATAHKLSLDNFKASIYLAMSQRYNEFEDHAKALEFANHAKEAAVNITDVELKDEITDFLATLS